MAILEIKCSLPAAGIGQEQPFPAQDPSAWLWGVEEAKEYELLMKSVFQEGDRQRDYGS